LYFSQFHIFRLLGNEYRPALCWTVWRLHSF